MAVKLQIDLTKTVDVDWTTEKEHWNEYKLEDGTTLKVKIVLTGVKRSDQHSPDGTPIYAINSTNIVRATKVPKKLRKKPKKSTMKPV